MPTTVQQAAALLGIRKVTTDILGDLVTLEHLAAEAPSSLGDEMIEDIESAKALLLKIRLAAKIGGPRQVFPDFPAEVFKLFLRGHLSPTNTPLDRYLKEHDDSSC